MERKLRVYNINYASGMFDDTHYRENEIYSDKKLNIGDFVVVEHINHGIFIGKILEDVTDIYYTNTTDEELINSTYYRYIQTIDLSDYLNKIEKEKRKEELKDKMEAMFKNIDKEQKYKYYANLDENFKKVYDEYNSL